MPSNDELLAALKMELDTLACIHFERVVIDTLIRMVDEDPEVGEWVEWMREGGDDV